MIDPLVDRVRRRLSYELNRLRSTAVILLYHRIGGLDADPYGLCVSEEHFEEHLRVVRRIGRPCHLRSLAAHLGSGSLPDGAICVTFDDGYRDNLLAARPLLERHDVPATVFVVAGQEGCTREFWWDRLEDLFLRNDTLPARFAVEVDGERMELETGVSPKRQPDEDVAAGRGPIDPRERTEETRAPGRWQLGETPPTPRHRAFAIAWERLRPLPAERRDRIIDALFEAAGSSPRLREDRRTMTVDELRELEDGGLVEIGAHTAEHLHLPSHPAKIQEHDIALGRERLESWLGHPVATFAYPYGAVTEASVEIVRRHGFDAACAGHWAPIVSRSDRWRLPRVEVGDVGGEELERHLVGLLGR